MDQEAHEHFSSFLRKYLVWGNLIFLSFVNFGFGETSIEPDPWYYYLNSHNMVSFMIATGSLNSQGIIRILKKSGHDFSGKHLY